MRNAAPLAAVWLCLAVAESALMVTVPGTAARDPQLSAAARLTLVAYSIALIAGAVLVVGGAALTLRRLTSGRRSSMTVAGSAAAALVIWAATLFYSASWATFWNAGVFLDRAAFTFWAPHPVQVFHWVYPPLAAGVVIATTAATALLGWFVPRVVSRMSTDGQRRIAYSGGIAAAICALGAALGGGIYAAPVRDRQPAPRYVTARDDRTGPAARIAADLQAALAAGSSRPIQGSAGTGASIISMDDYVRGIDRSGFQPRNVLMIQVESLRADQLRAYGGSRDVMPAIDRLAREGRVFSRAYVQATHSNYADLVPLSSHYPLRYRQMYEYPENPTYPRVLIYDILKALGYRTAVVSSQNERWGGMINFHRPASLDRFFHAEVYDGPTISPFEDAGFAEWVRQTRGAGSVDDRYTVDEAMRWLDSVQGAPFFLHMNLQSSHVPYVVPEDFPRPFGPAQLDFAILWGRFPIDRIQIVKDRYADSLYYADAQIARLFAHLRRRGLWDDTIVVIGGDNGEAFYEHGLAAHASTPYEEVVRVPMIIRVPGEEPDVDNRPAMFLDVPPSILALMGLPPHPAFQGRSLFRSVPDPDRPIFTMVQTPLADQIAVIRGDFKLIYSVRDGAVLYDLARDPREQRNLAASRPDIVEELSALLLAWRDRQLAYYGDTARHTREYPPRDSNF